MVYLIFIVVSRVYSQVYSPIFLRFIDRFFKARKERMTGNVTLEGMYYPAAQNLVAFADSNPTLFAVVCTP